MEWDANEFYLAQLRKRIRPLQTRLRKAEGMMLGMTGFDMLDAATLRRAANRGCKEIAAVEGDVDRLIAEIGKHVRALPRADRKRAAGSMNAELRQFDKCMEKALAAARKLQKEAGRAEKRALPVTDVPGDPVSAVIRMANLMMLVAVRYKKARRAMK